MRTFVAVDLPDNIRDGLRGVAADLKKLRLHGRAPRIEGIHLTLKFLGEVDEARIRAMEAALSGSCAGLAPFQLSVGGVGVFPHLARPRVLWVGVESVSGLERLQSTIETALQAVGFAPETRRFHPHLTVMRIKSPKNLARLIEFVREYPRSPIGTFCVDRFHLYESLLRPDGARYQRLHTFRLGSVA